MNIEQIVQAILFAIFGGLTITIALVTGPTYDNLLVPELSPDRLFPVLSQTSGGSFYSVAGSFSNYLLENLVDPAVAILILGIGIAYLARASWSRFSPRLESLFPRMLIAIVVANFSVPIAGAILGLVGATYPIVAAFDGGKWQHWTNLAGVGFIGFSWDNGALAFVLSFVLFGLVLLLALAVAIRDALLAVLIVLLPIFTLLWPLPSFAPLARRAWKLFGELAFWPCVVLIPLELAVGSTSVLLLVALLAIALGSPVLLSTAGTHITAFGLPAVSSVVGGGTQRGLGTASQAAGGYLRPLSHSGASGSIAGSASRTLGSTTFPATMPVLAAEFLGRGAGHLIRHLRSTGPGTSISNPRFSGTPRDGQP